MIFFIRSTGGFLSKLQSLDKEFFFKNQHITHGFIYSNQQRDLIHKILNKNKMNIFLLYLE
jgi:hypothetical protein